MSTEPPQRTPTDDIRELLARAYMYDDKPHQLFSFIRQLALRYPDRQTPEIVRLMDQAYDAHGKVNCTVEEPC